MSEEQKQIKKTILFGYLSEMESFHDVLTALNEFDYSTLHSKKKAEIRDYISDIQKQMDELLNKLN